MSRKDIRGQFTDSLDRCMAKPRFLLVFFENYRQASRTPKSRWDNAFLVKQKRLLAQSLALLVMSPEAPITYISELAELQSEYGLITASKCYELWLKCLIQAAGTCDDKFSSDVELAWRTTLAANIATKPLPALRAVSALK